jgi:type IV secretion system protein VirB10
MSETAATPDQLNDVRPIVRTGAASNLGVWTFGAVLLIGGFLLFDALSDRRAEIASTSLPADQAGGSTITAPPPLSLPPRFADPELDYADPFAPRVLRPAAVPAAAPAPQVVTRIVERPAPAAVPQPFAQPAFALPPPVPVTIESRPPAEPAASRLQAGENERVTAGRLVNPSLTVPQGVIIAAVLETALDSTRPGGVRAIVSRDVRSFDGSRVLIPRGSRLYGEYAADMATGQKRALIRWRRLTRPDAVIIDLDSPAADPLGRAGVGGRVNTHFFERFGGAILQSVLDIGVGVATRSVTDTAVIVGLPGSTQQVTGQTQLQQQPIQPTLKVQQGASVSVFVARDLDFSTVER